MLKDTNFQAIYPNGDIYCGQHKGGQKHGKGTYIYTSTGLTYNGEWKNNRREGKGELFSENTYANGIF
jgi:hypothetical protein